MKKLLLLSALAIVLLSCKKDEDVKLCNPLTQKEVQEVFRSKLVH